MVINILVFRSFVRILGTRSKSQHTPTNWAYRKATHFRVLVRGGKFTKLAHGVAFDSFRSEAMPGPASEFCVLYKLTKSATFALNLYGEDTCICLANGWSSRLQQLFDVWNANERNHVFVFEGVHLASIVEAPEFVALLACGHSATQTRAQQIRCLVPRR